MFSIILPKTYLRYDFFGTNANILYTITFMGIGMKKMAQLIYIQRFVAFVVFICQA